MKPNKDPSPTSESSESQSDHQGADDFSAVKSDLHAEAHGGGHGGNEMGWLVSYADMMTLLFGLFVILYSLRTDKTKDADEVMKQVSKDFFSAPEKPKPEPIKITPQMLEEIKAQLQIEKTKSQTLENQVKVITSQKQELEEEKKIVAQKVESLKKLIPPPPMKVESKQPLVETLKQENVVLKEQNEKLIEKLRVAQAQIKPPERAPQSVPVEQVDQMKQQMASVQKENEELKKEIESSQKSVQTYLMIVLSWETEKHDLDLSVTTPGQKMFDFKHRKISGAPGEFQIDSRFGPGIEMWKAENFQSGQYKIKSSFYNSNGNPTNARVRVSVITNSQTYRTDVLEIPITKKNMELKFDVDPKGKISIQNSSAGS